MIDNGHELNNKQDTYSLQPKAIQKIGEKKEQSTKIVSRRNY